MRCSSFVRVLVLASILTACGGGSTPPLKAAGEAAENGASKSEKPDEPKTEEPKDKASATPAEASEAPAASESKPSPAKPSNGDLAAPAADDPWMAPHQMPPGDVLKTMRAAMGKVNGCYRTAKKHDSSVGGEVKIKFVITHEGSVRVWRDEDSSMTDPECTKCVGEVIKGLKFPTQKSPGDAWGVYTINFGG
ncbi:MAG TPA: AgmX/PglI C-terminal domain-containing protein [Polyangiaceae bacterium]|nr:AgmX/PglI C-terminal domain-containing protein [Polyangiaceae bacterium]